MEFRKIRDSLFSIEEGYVRCFLIIGKTQALLIDTGVQPGIRAEIARHTSLPLQVVLTHADKDHSGQGGEFEEVWMHPAEMDYWAGKTTGPVLVSPLWEGMVLEAGPYQLEVILTPGHTPGSIVLLERKARFLIAGDTLQNESIFMFGPGRNLQAYRFSMERLETMSGQWDEIYGSHGELCVPLCRIGEGKVLAEKVLGQELKGEPVLDRFDGKIRRYRWQGASFFCEPAIADSLISDGEPKSQ